MSVVVFVSSLFILSPSCASIENPGRNLLANPSNLFNTDKTFFIFQNEAGNILKMFTITMAEAVQRIVLRRTDHLAAGGDGVLSGSMFSMLGNQDFGLD